jgi:hypothetical protein
MPDLTDADYDALFAVIQADMPRIWREILAQREGTGVLTLKVTDTEITVSSPKASKTAVYRVEWKRSCGLDTRWPFSTRNYSVALNGRFLEMRAAARGRLP